MSRLMRDHAARARLSRRLRTDPIPEADLHTIMEAAIHAPNGGNAQPWRFILVRDPELRARHEIEINRFRGE